MTFMFDVQSSPFAEAKKDAVDFCHNLFLSNAVHECVVRMSKIEKEYQKALLTEDEDLIKQKKLELTTFQSSLVLTALMLESTDEIST
tara:strand:+ start:113 stop:376 length:264 start_codon:yes stop_codon:yes gene_type:complete